MHFTRVKLENFGPFSKAEFDFQPYAINWFIGNNGAGKTQMVGAILAAVVGKPVLSITPDGVGPSAVEVAMEDSGAIELAHLVVSESVRGKPVVSKTTGPLTLQVLATMSESQGQRLLMRHSDTIGIEALDLGDIERALPDVIAGDPLWGQLRRQGAFGLQTGSRGQSLVVELVAEFVIRRRALFKLPLIIDDVAPYWPQNFFPLIHKLLEEIARDSQVIVLAPHYDGFGFRDSAVRVISSTREGDSLAAFNQWYTARRPNLRRTRPLKWIMGTAYRVPESRLCEFKEVKGGNPLGSIKGVVDQYAVAFLNAGLPQEGAIFWGIRDEDRAIVGVKLSPRECDELKRIVTERLHQIVPPIAPTAYRIDLHPVTDGVTVIDDLYVVEVRVPSIRRTLLFATGGQEVYVKTDAGKRKLSTVELQQELVRRLGVDPDF